MGTKVYVSSSISNLGQADSSDSKFVTATVLTGVLSGASNQEGLGRYISSTILGSNGFKLRNYFNWVSHNYPNYMPSASVEDMSLVDTAAVKAVLRSELGLNSTESLNIIKAFIDNGDIDYFAEEWMRDNYPSAGLEEWSAYFNFSTNQMAVVYDGTTYNVTPPSNLLWSMGAPRASKRLLYVTYNVVTQDSETKALSSSAPVMFTYKSGDGIVGFDALFNSDSPMAEFYPEIPLRVNNVSINDQPSVYERANKQFKKLTGSSIEQLAQSIDDNANVDEIDHAFIMHGVPLNTSNQSALDYVYRFFENLIAFQGENNTSYELFNQNQSTSNANKGIEELLFSSPELIGTSYAGVEWASTIEDAINVILPKPNYMLRVDGASELDIRLTWTNIREIFKTGNGARFDNNQTRPLLKKGELLVIESLPESISVKEYQNGGVYWANEDLPKFYLVRQYASNKYSVLEVTDMQHHNYVYGSHAVHITATQAFADDKESPFLVPLHYPTLKEMGLNHAENISKNCSYLLVNSYQVIQTTWLEDNLGWLIPVLAVVFSVVTGGASLGLLGTNAAVGASIGLTGTAAVIAGATLNMIAAAVVTQLIVKASVAVFGEKVGRVIGTIASFLFIGWKTGQFGETFEFSDLFTAENIVASTNAASQAYTSFLNADTLEIYEALENAQTEYEEESERIMALAEDVLGVTNLAFDPMIFSDATEYFGESSQSFLDRTLLTGSDVVRISHGIIENFVDVTLELPRALT